MARVLRLVAEGRLTADEAAPILDALDDRSSASDPPTSGPESVTSSRHGMPPGQPRYARIEVFERGRTAVNLRIPVSLGRRALGAIPGLSSREAGSLDEAIAAGLSGPIVDVKDDDGDGVRIVLE